MSFNIEMSQRDILNAEMLLSNISNGRAVVQSRAVNRTLTTIHANISQKIQREINLPSRTIKNSIKKKTASRDNPIGSIECSGKPISLIHFQAREVVEGVSVKIKRAGSRELLPHAFIENNYVFWRKNIYGRPYNPMHSYGRMPRSYRFPIKPLYGPRVSDILENNNIMNEVLELANEKYQENFNHELEYVLS